MRECQASKGIRWANPHLPEDRRDLDIVSRADQVTDSDSRCAWGLCGGAGPRGRCTQAVTERDKGMLQVLLAPHLFLH